MAVEITSDNFEKEVMKSDKPVLLDLWAVWCGPCGMISPVLDEIESEHPEIKVGKINVDNEMELAVKFQANAIPMLVYIRDGKVADVSVGVVPKERILEMIAK